MNSQFYHRLFWRQSPMSPFRFKIIRQGLLIRLDSHKIWARNDSRLIANKLRYFRKRNWSRKWGWLSILIRVALGDSHTKRGRVQLMCLWLKTLISFRYMIIIPSLFKLQSVSCKRNQVLEFLRKNLLPNPCKDPWLTGSTKVTACSKKHWQWLVWI
jgi:hypothetical protein